MFTLIWLIWSYPSIIEVEISAAYYFVLSIWIVVIDIKENRFHCICADDSLGVKNRVTTLMCYNPLQLFTIIITDYDIRILIKQRTTMS